MKNDSKVAIATVLGAVVGLWLGVMQHLPLGKALLAAVLSGLLVFALLIILKFRP